MKRRVYFGLILCFALLVCTFVLTACDLGEQPIPPGETETEQDVQTAHKDPPAPEQTEQNDSHEHLFSEWVVTKEPTCVDLGVKEQYCACGEVQTEAIEMLAHVEVVTSAVLPTCTESGLTEGTHCEICLNTIVPQTEIPPLGHLETHAGQREPTCVQDGNTGDHMCKRCLTVFETGEVIPATGHDYTYKEEIVYPTCEKPGYTLHYCHCGDRYQDNDAEALGHSFGEWYTYREATCTKMGLMHMECMRCNHVEKQELPSLGHSYSIVVIPPTCTEQGYTRYTCHCGDMFVDDYTSALGHGYDIEVILPTCLTQGYTVYTCYCGHTYKDSYVAPSGHAYAETVTPPTCTEQGYTTYTCHCGDTYVSDYSSPVEHELGEFFITVNPTCVSSGVERRNCLHCGHYQERSIYPLGHDTTKTVVAPTCTEQGYTLYTCVRCNDEYRERYTNAIGHAHIKEEVAATCTEQGYVKYICQWCQDEYYESFAEPYGHYYSETTVTKPTCIEQGYTTHSCIRCGDSYVDSYTDTVGHTMKHTFVSATCTEGGYTLYTCTYCGHSYTGDPTEPKGHNFWRWEVDVQATCTQNGRESRYCMGCKMVEERVVEAPGHQFNDSVKKVTCTTDGYTTHSCSNCGYTYTDSYVTATGHSYTEWVVENPATCIDSGRETRHCTKCQLGDLNLLPALGHDYKPTVTQPTCWNQGYTTYTCRNCNRSYDDNVTAKLDHICGEWQLEREPTCTLSGNNGCYCLLCNHHKTESIPALGHDFSDVVVTEPTCRSEGYTTHNCTRCDKFKKDSYINRLPCNYTVKYEVAPTCTAFGYAVMECDMCLNTYEDTNALPLGHDYAVEQIAPTCSEKGCTAYTCQHCGDRYTENETAALGHDYQTEVTAPTCTTYGYTTYTCSRCYHSYETDATMPTEHISEDIPPIEPTFETNGWIGGRRCAACGMQLEAQTEVGRYMHIYVEYNQAAVTVDAPDKASLGTYITITAKPKSGYEFVGWYIGDVLMCETPDYTFQVGVDEYTYIAKVKSSNTWDGKVGDGFAGGSGTEADPYLISNGWQLAYLAYQINHGDAAQYNNKYYALTADIDLGNVNWDPIGCIYNTSGTADTSKAFIGHFDGRGYTVYNLFINTSNYNFYRFFGLFGVVEAGGYVENVNVSNCNINIDGDVKGLACCGGIAGRIVAATVENCTTDGKTHASTSSGGVRVGGIVGIAYTGSVIADCQAEVTVSGSSSDNNAMAGGIVGNVEGTTVARCLANATVSASGSGSVYVVSGGIVGYAHTSSVIHDCYSTGSVSGSNRRVECRVGGIVGAISDATVARCYTTCTVFSKSEKNAIAGGVVGHMLEANSGNSVYQCLSLASVSADNYGGWYTYTGKIYGYKADGSLSSNQTSKTDTVEFYTSTLGWSSDVWDFSEVTEGGLPTLKH
ncbi:MAG: hypothetical protein IJW70_07175 [Clostridia bacterium]|nr:hypothetical protein [Clostridia bacterium]